MDINTTDLTKLLELNQKGLISDEILADALKERYLKEEKVEKTEEEKRQELIEKNRERTNSIREKWLEKAKEEEYQKKNEINNDKQDKEIQEMKDSLALEKNVAGEFVYSSQYLNELEYLELLALYHTIKENKSEKPINVKPDYIDSLKFINIIKKKGTICLALAKDEYDENVYVVYQNKYNVIGFDRIDPKAFGYNISEAEKEYEKRVEKEEKELTELYDEKEKSIENEKHVVFSEPELSSEEPVKNDEHVVLSEPELPTLNPEPETQKTSSGVIDDINNLGDEADPELGDLNKAAENVTKAETDTKFETVEASPERIEKLKNSKKSALVKGLKILGVVAAASILLATGTGLLEVGILTGTGVFSYNYFAKKIREGTWEPKNGIEKFMKYSTEKIMNLGNSESKVR